MENCLYHGKAICTFDLKDESGFYYEDLVIEWKKAAARRELTCIECGEKVYLAAGPLKEPYFAHYDSKECDYGNGHETEELKKGKRLLYQLLKRSYPESPVISRYRMENGMYSTFFCQYEGELKLAVDFRLQNNSLEKFQMRDSYYQENHITPFYILGISQDLENKQFTWYQNLIQKSMEYCAFLDVDKESFVLKKSFGYRIGEVRKFSYCRIIYRIKDLLIGKDGHFICDFLDECMKIEKKIQEIKEQHLITHKKEHYNLNPVLLEKCKKMIEEGNGHLVSKKYYDAITLLSNR